MKIIGFCQLHNELRNGNLENFASSMNEVCDYVYAYDQASNDGSRELYEKNKWNVIYSDKNDFNREIFCKAELMQKLMVDHPDVDWVFWMDGDTILDGRLNRSEMECMLNQGSSLDGICIPHYNLWRSDIYYRVDNNYHCFASKGAMGVLCLWNAKKVPMEFDLKDGLHKEQSPYKINTVAESIYAIIHRGFATDESIIRKFKNYKERGLDGYALERLLDERTLDLKQIEMEAIPSWFEIKDTGSVFEKKPIAMLYEESL